MTAVGAVSAGLEARRRPLYSVSPPSITVLGRPPSGSWAGPEPRSSLGCAPSLAGEGEETLPPSLGTWRPWGFRRGPLPAGLPLMY